jgi:hypothetical protein
MFVRIIGDIMSAQHDRREIFLDQQPCLQDFPKKSAVLKCSALYAVLLFCVVSSIQVVVFYGILPSLDAFSSDLSQFVLFMDGLLILMLQKRLAKRVWQELCPMPVVSLSTCRQKCD